MKDNRLLFLVSVGVLVLSVLFGTGLSLLSDTESISALNPPVRNESGDFSVEVREGRLPGAENYPINEDGTGFLYTMNTAVTVNRDGLGSIMLENTTGNRCNIIMELRLDDSNEIIYMSPRLAPNTCFTSDVLMKTPKPGSYNATATITAYDTETDEELAVKTRLLTLTVTK